MTDVTRILKAQSAERAKGEISAMLIAVTDSHQRMKFAQEARWEA